MNGGDPILGGGQANPDNTQPINTGSQPAPSAAPAAPQTQPSSPTPQAPQSTVSPAPAPANASPSPDAFSSFSAQPTRPVVPSRPPVYGSSFSRPVVGRPLPPTSRPIGQPVNPMAPNSIMNSGPVPPSAFPSSGQVVFSDAGSISSESSGKGKKIAIIMLLLLLVAGGVMAALFATGILGGGQSTDPSSQSGSASSTEEKPLDVLSNFNLVYTSLADTYNYSVGLIPHFSMSEDDIFFPAESITDTMSQMSKNATDAYNQKILALPDKLENNVDFTSTKDAIGKSLDSFNQNINLIQEFYDAYIAPLFDDSKPTTCSETEKMFNLNNGNTAEAASKYYILYCDTISYFNLHSVDLYDNEATKLLKQEVSIPASEAATALNKLLVEVPSAAGDIDKLLKELSQ